MRTTSAKPLKVVAVFCLVLTVVMIANLTRVQFITADTYTSDPRNKREAFALKSSPRGMITAGRAVIATSNKGPDGFYHRSYPGDPTVFAPIIGYASDIYGLAGIEQGYNGVLSGSDVSGTEGIIAAITGTQAPAENIELTIDPMLQNVAYRQLADNNYIGAAVAIKPSTGEILALASTPTFNPRLLSDNDTAAAAFARLTAPGVTGSPLLDHATQTPLPPGSTFKVITTAAALESGKFGPQSVFTAAPRITLPGTNTTLENYAGTTCGSGATATLETAFALSCNTAFAQLGAQLSAKQLGSMAKKFGVTATVDLGIPDVPGTIGNLDDDAARAQSAIGQRDVTMTALNGAMIAATVANKGERMTPGLVKKITRPDNSVVTKFTPHVAADVISESTAIQLTAMMKHAEAWAHGGAHTGLASKTGTAEHGVNSRGSKPHAWYLAFDPRPGADIAVAVVVENGGNAGQAATGGTVAAPIGRAIINAAANEPKEGAR